MASGRRVAGAIGSLVNAREMQLECTRVLHETLLVPLLMYCSETMLWKEKERYRVMAVQVANLKGLLGIRMMHRIQNARIRELYGVRIAKSVYVGEYTGSLLFGGPGKRWIDTMNEC